MAPHNDSLNPIFNVKHSNITKDNFFDLSDSKLSVKGVPLLTNVPKNVNFRSFSSICQSSAAPQSLYDRVQSTAHKGGFLGFRKTEESDTLINSLGRFSGRDFLSIFRFKTWWSTQWVGNCGSDLQKETQWVLFDVPEISCFAIILPIIEGKFRSALQPGAEDHVVLCAESGSAQAKTSFFDAIAYVHVAESPFKVMKEAFSAVRVHLNTFKLLEEKSVPSLVDKFGWCTWDAFYLTVEPAGVWHGLKEFEEGGISPRFVIIDDGWQSINVDDQDNLQEDTKNLVLGGTQMTARLHRLDEGEKFRKYQAGSLLGHNQPPYDPKKPKMLISKAIEIEHAEKAKDKAAQSGITDLSKFESRIQQLRKELNEMFGDEHNSSNIQDTSCKSENFGMKAFTGDLRRAFKGLDDIYVWHALCGAWGGVRPKSTHLESKVIPCKLSAGLDRTMEDLAVVKIVEGGIGLVHPDQAHEFYESMHSYLASAGVTGVKVDVIHTLEYVCEDYGGRVQLGKAYYNGLSKSVAKNFRGSGLISSMQQCNDFFFLGTQQISMGRVGDDFWFQDPNGDPNGVYWLQGVHMIHCAYNSLWMGQIIQPDWDMFQSDHCCAKFHAASRAICGGPVYVSDSLGGHDMDLLKKLVFPDGTIPKCMQFALPTRDCMFKNPLFDGKTILKVWNLNKYGGVVGAFNCQGGGWDPKELRFKGYPECYKQMLGSVKANDIEWPETNDDEKSNSSWYAVYASEAEELVLTTSNDEGIGMSIEGSSFEIYTFVPIKEIGEEAKFAPIGLTNMFNCGGCIEEVKYKDIKSVDIEVKGGGSFLSYSSISPKSCILNGRNEVGFEWSSDGKLVISLPWLDDICNNLSFVF